MVSSLGIQARNKDVPRTELLSSHSVIAVMASVSEEHLLLGLGKIVESA